MACVAYFPALQSTLENLRDILSILLSRLGILAQILGDLLNNRADIELRRFVRRRFSFGRSWAEDAMRHIHPPFPTTEILPSLWRFGRTVISTS